MAMKNNSGINQYFDRLAHAYTLDEAHLVPEFINRSALSLSDRQDIQALALRYVNHLRAHQTDTHLMDALLQEYGLSTEEGLILMRLAEALVRTPDFETERRLIRDKILDGAWSDHAGQSSRFLVNQATQGLRLSKFWIRTTGGAQATHLAAKLGDHVLNLAIAKAMTLMGEHFVLGKTIQAATYRARSFETQGYSFSYDMLGEAAYTAHDAERYFNAYLNAIRHLAQNANGPTVHDNPGISVKLSALHPRYEYAKRDVCIPILVERLTELARIAQSANLGLTIDAEEADRLEISLLIFEQLLKDKQFKGWDGLGLAIQAYQRRAQTVIQAIINTAQAYQRKITVRLVKGAYWDMEIKRAQELGLSSYPVFTRRENTDASYLACARELLNASSHIYAQFATHNALTAASIIHMTGDQQNFEFQRLHGMGEALHKQFKSEYGNRCRIYAPVGNHKDLLPYLVRRLLENGANSSFVNQLFDEDIAVETLIEDPFSKIDSHSHAAHPQIPAPQNSLTTGRLLAQGRDITQSQMATHCEALFPAYTPYKATSLINGRAYGRTPTPLYNPARLDDKIGSYSSIQPPQIDRAIQFAQGSQWAHSFTPEQRAECLNRIADQLETHMDEFQALCVLEAGKSHLDAIAEIREAIDFCRYYAAQSQTERMRVRAPLGVIACISPWNFPLAIFLGQIIAALSLGNTVIAKPAPQTPLIAHKAIKLLFECGVPHDAVHLLLGDGVQLGNYLTRHADIQAICFTGSTRTAKIIAKNLADTNRSTRPLIAETGGINAMIIDSTALLEQAIEDVIASAFQSAGQRCSACRIVCVQDDIADKFVAMLTGAMAELDIGDPATLSTDVGPVIDQGAYQSIQDYIHNMRNQTRLIGEAPPITPALNGHYINPVAFEIDKVSDLEREIFGPVLHMVRFKSSEFNTTIHAINNLGYGLTMGLHSRIDQRIKWLSEQAKIGNLYVNRNQIGAVVGVQPFGGEGLSGTGPKAGGPHYLLRLSRPSHTDPQHVLEKQSNLISPVSIPLTLSEGSQPLHSVQNVIDQAKLAAKQWASFYKASNHLKYIDQALSRLDYKENPQTLSSGPQTRLNLPGPTGETNQLNLSPRGVILCVAPKDQIISQIILALSTGNSVIAITTSDNEAQLNHLSQVLDKIAPVSNLVQSITIDHLADGLACDIDAVAVDGNLRSEIGDFLCRRPGAILPLLSAKSDPERFFHERTVTINTSAAGGNATLLTLA